ncbi:MAG: amidohydrolase family protein [Bryobacterales bacterium]|nr:amidohydrolase family protein [Bryobacterales bacterium]
MPVKIDSHHHLWNYTPQEYGWISDPMKIIRRDFVPMDLRSALGSAGVSGAVTVQARETLEETTWLLTLAKSESKMQGVVGWVPLVEPRVGDLLEKLAADPKMKGVRHVLQDDKASVLMEDNRFNAGVGLLPRHKLVYDILIYERHLKMAIPFVDRHPNQVFVLDHIAKPLIKDHVMEPWRTLIRDLARRPNVYCKLSGMVTEADWRNWNPADLKPYIDVVLEAFRPRRLMFGSDWPVMLVASSYKRWHDVVAESIASLTEAEQERIWSGSATEAYKL